MLVIVGMLIAGMLMDEFWKRRACVELPGRPSVALTPSELKLLESDGKSIGIGDAAENGHVLSHCTLMQLGRRDAVESVVYKQ